MLFNTLDFVIFFVLVLSIIAIVKSRQFQHIFLLLASYFFYYFSSNYLIVLLLYSTILDFYLGKAIWLTKNQRRKKILLIASLSGNLSLLGFFKYADFAITQFNFFGSHFNLGSGIPLLNLALPIGISFYTFHTMTYTIDIYRGILTPTKSLKEFALFVAFFPTLVAGPILRAKEFLPQLREVINSKVEISLRQFLITNSNLKLGITIMAFGFVKKIFFADNLATMANEIFSLPIGEESFTIILGTIAFGIQIYCDFSGYTDIATGAALILGIKLPINFNMPYFATSPSNFWRRWNISLSSWLRDYLYIPLGGNKKGKARTYLNLLITMFLGGLWHGAAWNFVLWGILHGSYLAIHKLILDVIPSIKNIQFFKTKIGIMISIFVTQYFIFLAWITFRARDNDYLIYYIKKYVILDFSTSDTLQFISTHKFPVSLLVLFFIIHVISYKNPLIRKKISSLDLKYWFLILTGIMSLIFLFYNGNPEQFIYFKF